MYVICVNGVEKRHPNTTDGVIHWTDRLNRKNCLFEVFHQVERKSRSSRTHGRVRHAGSVTRERKRFAFSPKGTKELTYADS